MQINDIIEELRLLGSQENRKGMARFGINTASAFGISMKNLEPIARKLKKNHNLAIELWETGIHEARILAILIANPELLTSEQINIWVNDFNSWDLCDQACIKLLRKSNIAIGKIQEFILSEKVFTRRAGFALIATLAVHLKTAPDTYFDEYFTYIIKYAEDDRNFVKKAINWALRQIGKRNAELNQKAIEIAKYILETYPNSKSAKWIANDAIKELLNPAKKYRFE